MTKDLRPVYTAIKEAPAAECVEEFHDRWGEHYPALKGLWANASSVFVSFLDYPPEIRQVIYSSNAIESLSACSEGRPERGAISPTTTPPWSFSTSSSDPSTPPA